MPSVTPSQSEVDPSVRSPSPFDVPRYLAIDLGSSFMRLSAYHPDIQDVRFISDERDRRKIPCYVCFPDDLVLSDAGKKSAKPLIGWDAKEWMRKYPKATVFSWSQLLGLKYSDSRTQFYQRYVPYKIAEDNHGRVCIQVEHDGHPKSYRPEDLTAMLLSYGKTIAERQLSRTVTDAVITVPAGYSLLQRDATKEAARRAGLSHARIISNAGAAAVAFGYDRPEKERQGTTNAISINIGAAHVDCAAITIDNGVFEMLGTAGDVGFGSADVDTRLLMYFVEEIQKKFPDKKLNSLDLLELKYMCEHLKMDLSKAVSIAYEVPLSFGGYKMEMTRQRLEELSASFIERCLVPIKQVLVEARLNPENIGDIVLSGGGSYMPALRKRIEQMFTGKKIHHFDSIDASKAVGYGAAIEAALLTGVRSDKINEYLLIDALSFSLGVLDAKTNQVRPVIWRNTPLPTQSHFVLRPVISSNTTRPTSVVVKFYEGEATAVGDCEFMGVVEIPVRQAQNAREVEIDVQIDIDVDRNVVASFTTDGRAIKVVKLTDYPMPSHDVGENWKSAPGVTLVEAAQQSKEQIRGQGGSHDAMDV
ncbi:heat shock protein 70 family [Gaertneriomyces semiglobifer]|nr:heat shock protein 70 family [Gaertneriomyces semiglobifer]